MLSPREGWSRFCFFHLFLIFFGLVICCWKLGSTAYLGGLLWILGWWYGCGKQLAWTASVLCVIDFLFVKCVRSHGCIFNELLISSLSHELCFHPLLEPCSMLIFFGFLFCFVLFCLGIRITCLLWLVLCCAASCIIFLCAICYLIKDVCGTGKDGNTLTQCSLNMVISANKLTWILTVRDESSCP